MYDCKDAGGRTTQEIKSRWYDYMEVIGRVESGTETEKTSGTSFRGLDNFIWNEIGQREAMPEG